MVESMTLGFMQSAIVGHRVTDCTMYIYIYIYIYKGYIIDIEYYLTILQH